MNLHQLIFLLLLLVLLNLAAWWANKAYSDLALVLIPLAIFADVVVSAFAVVSVFIYLGSRT